MKDICVTLEVVLDQEPFQSISKNTKDALLLSFHQMEKEKHGSAAELIRKIYLNQMGC